MADHHTHLRHGSRFLNLFRDDNFNDSSSMSMTANTTTITTSMLVENDGLPPDSSAPWSTRKTILLAEAIVVTAIVLPLVFCFLYQRASKSGQARSTSRSSRSRHHHADGAAAAAEVVMTTSDRTLRSILQQQQEEFEAEQQQYQGEDQPPRTLIQRLASLPSTLLSILSYPFHAIDAGVNSWSTANADITFLRSVMERLEEERVAQLEDVEERGERLKLAFSEGDSVWEIAEEHFVPPPTLYALSPSSPEMMAKYIGGVHNYNTASSAMKDKEGLMEQKIVEERELGEEEEEEELNEEEVKRVDDKYDDAMHTANGAADDAIANTSNDNEAVQSDNNKKERIDGENYNNLAEEGNEQNHLSSSLLMDETNVPTRSVSPLMADEDEEFVGELTFSSPPRSSSPLDTSEAPAYLYLPNRKSRSRANTNETATTANLASLASSSMHSQSFGLDSIPTNSNHMTNYCTQIENNSADAANNATFVEEDELESIPNNCAICLSEYVSGDTIVTSCDPMCTHAFHQECIIEWLVKMQVGAPCPCCRRTFVELSPSRPSAAAANAATTTAANGGDSNTINGVATPTASLEEQERRRVQLRREIQLGIRRGRAFDFSVISLR